MFPSVPPVRLQSLFWIRKRRLQTCRYFPSGFVHVGRAQCFAGRDLVLAPFPGSRHIRAVPPHSFEVDQPMETDPTYSPLLFQLLRILRRVSGVGVGSAVHIHVLDKRVVPAHSEDDAGECRQVGPDKGLAHGANNSLHHSGEIRRPEHVVVVIPVYPPPLLAIGQRTGQLVDSGILFEELDLEVVDKGAEELAIILVAGDVQGFAFVCVDVLDVVVHHRGSDLGLLVLQIASADVHGVVGADAS
mmetsp:Transcript_32537/g.63696  ORF Transcript_32537/g.63696 Transcript_32537/m.63696 type:complete len:245 (-) Transcript_32537:842-1576(-)